MVNMMCCSVEELVVTWRVKALTTSGVKVIVASFLLIEMVASWLMLGGSGGDGDGCGGGGIMSKIEVVVEYVCVSKEKLDHSQFFCIRKTCAVAAAVQPMLLGKHSYLRSSAHIHARTEYLAEGVRALSAVCITASKVPLCARPTQCMFPALPECRATSCLMTSPMDPVLELQQEVEHMCNVLGACR
jgi:hypothetical protein